mmetsp:Transcript_27624/g.54191  ORF Transcript_27624/g.54191 Transcript_27624/m.54191 type:complete len:206 (-) Transcript_27624:85-702(-)
MEGTIASWSQGFYDGKSEAFSPKLLGNELALQSLPHEDHHLTDEVCRRILKGVWAMKDRVQDALIRKSSSTAQPAARTCTVGQIVRLSFAFWQGDILADDDVQRQMTCPPLHSRGHSVCGRHGRRWQSERSPLKPTLESPLKPPPPPPSWTVNEVGVFEFSTIKMSTEDRRLMNDDLVKELAGLTTMLQRGKIIATTGDETVLSG